MQQGPAADAALISHVADRFAATGDELWLLPWAMGLWRQGRHSDALALTEQAGGPLLSNADFHILRGMVARQCPGQEAKALAAYGRALELDPNRADAHYNLANLLMADQPRAAEVHYRSSLACNAMDAKAWHNLGLTLNRLDRFAEALTPLHTSLQLDPLVADAWCNLGLAYQGMDRFDSAKGAFRQAISLDQNHAASHINMGNALVCSLEPDAALVYLQRGLELEESSSNALWNLALAYLLLGEFQQGWRYYEARFATEAYATVVPPTVGVQPQSLAACPRAGDPPLVVWSEQGMGDAIQFGRYLALLDAAGVPYEFRSRAPLLRLFQQWFGCGERALTQDSRTDQGDSRPQIALMSLPLLFGTELATVPSTTPYINPPEPPPPALRLAAPPGGLAVGLVWASNPDNQTMYRNKSLPLALLLPPLLDLIDLDLIELHSLQVGPDAEQLDPWRGRPGLRDWAPQLGDFCDTAHLIQQLDLVISVDTAVAHLAGAQAKPTWLLLPHNADYRWLRERSDSPWYPEMRLFRQRQQGDWGSVVAQVQEALDGLFLLDLQALAAAKLH
jgi:tetratricopeptide (TPR) repeat protein